MTWRIYYADGSAVGGVTEKDWLAAPEDGVQVVVLLEKPACLRWHWSGGAVADRELWTGEDAYNPFGWGEKRGLLIGTEAYMAIWERACADSAT